MRTCRAVVLIGLTAVLAVALPSVSAAATMSPVSGPSGGGTVVTISGGSGYNAYTMVNIHFYIPSNLLNMTVIPSYITPDGTSLGFLAPPGFTGLAEITTTNPATPGQPFYFYYHDTNHYAISASAGPDGTIIPSGFVSVNHGADQTFTIAAVAGYHVADVLVDGMSVGAIGSYTFNHVKEDHTISATFAVNTDNPFFDMKPPNGGDGNGDGILDSQQSFVASVPSATRQGYVTVEVTGGCDQLENVQVYTEASLGEDPHYNYPFGLLGFRLHCSSATIKIFFHGAPNLNGYAFRKYGPKPPNFNNPQWYTLPHVSFGTEMIGGQTVATAAFTLTDGQLGDDTGADGWIVCQGGPGHPLQEIGDAYREAVLRVKEEFHIPGVVAGVWVPGKKPWKIAQGFGDVEGGTPIGLDDHFPIRSATKSFTVTLILQLVRSKAISLDDPIEKYVPDIPNGKEITLAQLAAMESGVKDYSGVEEFLSALEEDPGRPWTPQELVDLAKPYSPVFAPGAEYDYSNTNTILLGMVVEKVTQQAIAEIYREWIFKPLGLRETSYPNNTNIPSPHPTPYDVDPVTGELTKSPTVNLSVFGASGGMVSTLEDLRRWGKALGKGHLIGSRLQKTRLQHSRPATSGPEYDRYGLGIGELKGWWGHTGEGLGYQAATFYDPKTGAVISVALNSSQPVNVATEVFKALVALVHPHGAGDDTTP